MLPVLYGLDLLPPPATFSQSRTMIMALIHCRLAETERTILHEPAHASGLHADQPYQVSHLPQDEIVALRIARK